MSIRELFLPPCITLCLALSLAACTAPFDADRQAAAVAQGQLFIGQFYDGEDDLLWAAFDSDMKTMMGDTQATLADFRVQVDSELGAEVEVVAESALPQGSDTLYLRKARFEKAEIRFDVVFSWSAEGKVTGFSIRPEQAEAPSKYLDYVTKTTLRLPFDEAWTVFWGGRALKQNYHTAYPDQRFAYDILIMKGGVTHDGDGLSLDDYYCFDLKVLAPGAGVVVSAENDVVDNVPGEMNPAQALGNHVIIDHGNGEFSFLAHFRQGTLSVAVGDKVEIGTYLGRCGNSGNTSEPHIHYHLQDTPRFIHGQGIPAPFVNYTADGKLVERGEPVRLQVVKNR